MACASLTDTVSVAREYVLGRYIPLLIIDVSGKIKETWGNVGDV